MSPAANPILSVVAREVLEMLRNGSVMAPGCPANIKEAFISSCADAYLRPPFGSEATLGRHRGVRRKITSSDDEHRYTETTFGQHRRAVMIAFDPTYTPSTRVVETRIVLCVFALGRPVGFIAMR